MSKLTCSICGHIIELKETMGIYEAIKYLIEQDDKHKCTDEYYKIKKRVDKLVKYLDEERR